MYILTGYEYETNLVSRASNIVWVNKVLFFKPKRFMKQLWTCLWVAQSLTKPSVIFLNELGAEI